ncbi:MAG: hypothetical protein ACTTKZ_03530 [Bacteroides sp.]
MMFRARFCLLLFFGVYTLLVTDVVKTRAQESIVSSAPLCKLFTADELVDKSRTIMKQLVDSGYLAAHLDSIVYYDSLAGLFAVYISPNPRYHIQLNDTLHTWTDNALQSLAKRQAQNNLKRNAKVESILEAQLYKLENHNGYLHFLESESTPKKLVAIEHHGNFTIPMWRWFLLLGIPQNSPLASYQIEELDETLRLYSEYISREKPVLELLDTGTLRLHLFVDRHAASYAEGQLGVQPNNNKEIHLFGNVELALSDLLHRNEHLKLRWKGNGKQWQKGLLAFTYPYLFGSVWGITGQCAAEIRDSTKYKWQLEGGVSFRITKFHTLLSSIENSVALWNEEENDAPIRSNSLFWKIGYIYRKIKDRTWLDGLFLHSFIDIGKRALTRETPKTVSRYELIFHYTSSISKWLYLSCDIVGKGYLWNRKEGKEYPWENFYFGGAGHFKGLSEDYLSTPRYTYLELEIGSTLGSTFRGGITTQLGELKYQDMERWAISYGGELKLRTNAGILNIGISQFRALKHWLPLQKTMLHFRLKISF